MKKYIVKYKDRNKVVGEYSSKEEASKKLMKYINDINEEDIVYISLFDFVLEEVECKDMNEIITAFETARKVLGIKPNNNFISIRGRHYEDVVNIAKFVNEIDPKHIEALVALNRLFTIAEAWNKEDGFVPDLLDYKQQKWFPLFDYTNDAGFVYATTSYITSHATVPLSPRLYFKTRERATQFGKQFADLYNKVFLS